MANEYREGDDDREPVPPKAPGDENWFNRSAEGSGPPEWGPQQARPFTAVLLVAYTDGTVAPVVNLESLDLHHQATPHEIYRMCADVADQVSSTRVIGEVLKHTQAMLHEHGRRMGEAFNALMPRHPQEDGK